MSSDLSFFSPKSLKRNVNVRQLSEDTDMFKNINKKRLVLQHLVNCKLAEKIKNLKKTLSITVKAAELNSRKTNYKNCSK